VYTVELSWSLLQIQKRKNTKLKWKKQHARIVLLNLTVKLNGTQQIYNAILSIAKQKIKSLKIVNRLLAFSVS